MNDLIRLIYRSMAVRAMSEADLLELLHKARQKNNRLSITGMLLYQKQTFLQVLEGSQPNVEDVFRSITRDERHYDVTLLLKNPIPKREYQTWDMKFANLDFVNMKTLLGNNAYAMIAPDFKHFEINSFAYTFLSIFRDLDL